MPDKMIEMVVFTSRDGKNDWKPQRLEQLPEWLLEPAIMGRLADGEECNNPAFGAAWYRAVITQPRESAIALSVKNLILQ